MNGNTCIFLIIYCIFPVFLIFGHEYMSEITNGESRLSISLYW